MITPSFQIPADAPELVPVTLNRLAKPSLQLARIGRLPALLAMSQHNVIGGQGRIHIVEGHGFVEHDARQAAARTGRCLFDKLAEVLVWNGVKRQVDMSALANLNPDAGRFVRV